MPEAAVRAQTTQTSVGGARAAASDIGAGYSVYDPAGQKIGIAER